VVWSVLKALSLGAKAVTPGAFASVSVMLARARTVDRVLRTSTWMNGVVERREDENQTRGKAKLLQIKTSEEGDKAPKR